MFTSLSAVQRNAVLSFTKLISLCAMAHDDEYKLSPKVKGMMKVWFAESKPFIKRFGLDWKEFHQMVNGLYRQHSPIEDEDMVEVTESFAASLKSVLEDVNIEKDVHTVEYKIAKDFPMVALRSSEPALARILKALSHLKEPALASLIQTEVSDQTEIAKRLERHVKKIGGKGLEITPELRKKLLGSDKLKEYNKLRRELNASPKQFIMQYVRASGNNTVPIQEVLEALKDANIVHHSVPHGYRGFIDDSLGYYTEAGLKLNGTPAGDVIMNPEYDIDSDNTYVCMAKAPMAKDYSRIYTVSYKQGNTQKKFEAVKDLQGMIDKVRRKWQADLKLGIDDRKAILALCCELVYLTSARVGSKTANTAGEKTFGLTTLLTGHYKTRGNDRLIEYKGKKSQLQKHMLKPSSAISKICIEYLDELSDGKKRVEPLITYRGKTVTGQLINKYLNSLGVPKGTTIHKFRTLRGTVLASSVLDKSPFKNRTRTATAKQVNDWLKKQLERVAKELGHFTNGKLTVNTAIQNYIDPQILDNFFTEAKVRPNAVIARSIELAKRG